ncbi:MAG: T9SS type A sorting domain-containing protein [Ignavibacteria bacterium]|nr:T9SS type A sorting domain-containing protein [Ignavibacteria bacterium]
MIKKNVLALITLLTLSFIQTLTYSQSNPTAQELPYYSNFSSLSHNSTTYPAGWQGWKISSLSDGNFNTSAPSSSSSLTSRGYASSTTKGIYNYSSKLGFLNASDGEYSLVLSVKTTGNSNVVVEYAVMTLRNPYNGSTNTRINGVELQYRIGTSGKFKSINSRVYINNTTNQTGTTTTEQNRKVFSVFLPAECSNQPVVQIRWVSREISGIGSFPSFAIDDVEVSEKGKSSYYYYKGTGNFASITSWTSNPDGTGKNPSDFTTDYQYFMITKPSSINFSELWAVTGTNSKVVIGTESSNVSLKTINSAQLNAIVDIFPGSKLNLSQSTSNFPDFGTLYPSSYLEYNFTSSMSNLPAEVTYENLLLNSAGGHTYLFDISSPDILIKNNFEIINTKLNVNGSEKFRFQLGGNLTFSSAASLTSGFSNLAELVFNGNNQQVIRMNGIDLQINSMKVTNPAGISLSETGGSSDILLSNGSGNVLTMDGGNISLGTNTITLGSNSTEPGSLSYSSGFFTGSGSFSRWFGKSSLPTTFTYAFPMGSGTKDRGISIAFSNNSITSGGKLTVSHNDIPGSTSITPFTDGTLTINKKSNMYWSVTQSNNWNLGSRTVSMKIEADGLEGVIDLSGLTIVKNNAKAGGTFISATGSTDKPEVNRTGLSITDLGGTGGTGNTFSIGASNGNPLPVTMESFTASAFKRDAVLSWVTSIEINNKGFEVERSKKEESTGSYSQWEKIGFVNGSGNTNTQTSYTFTDRKLIDGVYKYRIKQIDLNGNYEYFMPQNSAELVIGKPVNFEISQNYPNPSNPVSKIDFQVPYDTRVSLKVYDLTGKEVSVLADGNLTAGYHTVEFNGSNLASGIYIYKLTADNFTAVKKLVLVK